MDSSARVCIAIQYSVHAGTTKVNFHLGNTLVQLSGSCPASTPSKQFVSIHGHCSTRSRVDFHTVDSSPGVVPVRDYTVLNGILQLRRAALVLRLVIDITVLLVHTDRDVSHLGPADNLKLCDDSSTCSTILGC